MLIPGGRGRDDATKHHRAHFYDSEGAVAHRLVCGKTKKLLMCSPGDLTLVDLQASLGHVAHPLLALLAGVHGQEVDVRRLLCHLVVADAAVALQDGSRGARSNVRTLSRVVESGEVRV